MEAEKTIPVVEEPKPKFYIILNRKEKRKRAAIRRKNRRMDKRKEIK